MLSKPEAKAKFDSVAGERDVVAVRDLHQLLAVFGLPTSARDQVQTQGALRELYVNGDIADGIPFAVWYQWYKLEVQPGHFDHHNELLVRRVIGKVKYPTRNLKDNQFVYGQRNHPDKEGAGEVVLNWVVGKRSESKEAGVSLMKVNKEAVKQKFLTPKEVNKFLRENKNAPHLQRPKVVGRKKARGPRDVDSYNPPVDRARGEDMQTIIFPGTEGSAANEHYVDTTGQVRKGRLPKPRQTKCSEMLRAHTQSVDEQSRAVDMWKMNRFTKNAATKIVNK